jgi:predicted MFS family arabinose efflux permease
VNSLLPSFFNAGITLGTLLGGFIIVRFGIHEVIWVTVPLLLLALGLSFIAGTKKRPVVEKVAEPEPEFEELVCE